MAELEAKREMLMQETQVESACWENQIWQHSPDGRIVPPVAELYARLVASHLGIGHADAPWSSSFYIFSSIPWLPLVDLYYCVSSRFVGPLRLKLREVERVTRITGSRHHQTTTGASPINSDNGNDTCKTSVADWASRS